MNKFEFGSWNVVCQRCGRQRKSHELRREWTGLRTCSECWEPRHPQEFLRGKADRQAPPWTSPRPPEVELGTNEVTPEDL